MNRVEFLRSCPPFEQLTADELNSAAGQMEKIRFDRGERILQQGGEASAFLYVVRQGEVGLLNAGQVQQMLEPTELFGYPSLLDQAAPLFDVIAVTDVEAYRLSEKAFRHLLNNGAFARYFLGGLGERLRAALRASGGGADTLSAPVKTLIKRPPLFAPADATVQDAAGIMSRERASSVLIQAEPPGILTDRDLRTRVLAAGLGPETPVSQVMSQPVKSLDSDTPIFAALLHMLEEGIHHLALVEEGQVVGVVTSTDLLRHQAHSPIYLQRTLEIATTVEELQEYATEATHAVDLLHRGGLGAAQIGRIVSTLNDALVKKLVQLAEAELGPAPVPYAWIVFGSEGRSEQLLLTDQDNALIYESSQDGAARAEAYFAELTRRVVDGLIAAGFPPCPGGYMATNWRKPLDEWLAIFDGWIRTPTPQALMEAAIFFDFRPVHGELSLEPLEALITDAKKHAIFLGHLVRAAQEFHPPLGFFNRIRTDDGLVDLKQGGIAPIVGLARACSLAAGSRERSTLERLTAAAAGGTMSREGADNLAEMFQFLLALRLRQQLADVRTGRPPSNQVRFQALSAIERRHLKEAFVIIRQMQEGIGDAFRTSALGG